MSWVDRLREAAYTSPGGTRQTFIFDDVSRTRDRKTNPFEFPDTDRTFVQDLGSTGRRYPLECIFTGENCDLEAEAFEALLVERGAGLLEHPRYGQVDVIPVGTIERRDGLVNNANQVTIRVTFFETTGAVFPEVGANPQSSVLSAVDTFNETGAAAFENKLDIANVAEAQTFGQQFETFVATVDDALGDVAAAQADIESRYNAVKSSIDNAITVLVQKPLTLAFQAQRLAQLPSQIAENARARLDAYRNLANSFINTPTRESGIDNTVANLYYGRELFAMTAVSGQLLTTTNAQFATRSEAIQAADDILQLFEDVTNWRDDNYATLQELDEGRNYQALQEAVAITAGFVIDLSFDLRQERSVVLTESRNIVELVAELYQKEPDDELDFFITSNGLTGDEILELPAGREVVYYV